MEENKTCGNCEKRDNKGTCEINGKHMNPGLLAESCQYYEYATAEAMLRRARERGMK